MTTVVLGRGALRLTQRAALQIRPSLTRAAASLMR